MYRATKSKIPGGCKVVRPKPHTVLWLDFGPESNLQKLVLVRILSPEEAVDLNFEPGVNVIKIITARDMNQKQRRMYSFKKGS